MAIDEHDRISADQKLLTNLGSNSTQASDALVRLESAAQSSNLTRRLSSNDRESDRVVIGYGPEHWPSTFELLGRAAETTGIYPRTQGDILFRVGSSVVHGRAALVVIAQVVNANVDGTAEVLYVHNTKLTTELAIVAVMLHKLALEAYMRYLGGSGNVWAGTPWAKITQ
jgi:hypothetical protein